MTEPNKAPVDRLTDAARELRSFYSSERKARLNAHLCEQIEPLKEQLCRLVSAVHDDWYPAHLVRRPFAGYDAPYGKAETAAYAISLMVLEGVEPKENNDDEQDKTAGVAE